MTKFTSNEFVRYVAAGGFNTVIGYLAYVLLLPFISYTASYILTYIGGIFLAYYLNARFVFRRPLEWKKALQFPAVYVVQFAVGSGALLVLVESLQISEVVAPVFSLALTIPLTFVLSRLIIKGRPDSA